MTRMSSLIRAKAIEHKELIEKWEKKEVAKAPIQRPETRVTERVLQDNQYAGIVSRGVGRELYERSKIAKKDIDRFALIYSMSKNKFRAEVKRRLIPIMRRGYPWESTQSRRLREKYYEKADGLFGMLDNCELESEFFTDGASIEISAALSKTIEHLEFCSAAGLVDKKPRKRKEDKGGDAVFFQELFQRGERGVLFGVFDGFVEERGEESTASELAVKILKEYVEKIRSTRNSNDVQQLLTQYANEADSTISETMNNLGGTTASIGVLLGKQLTYLNIGDSRIYAVSLAGVPILKKITTDDGIAGAIERGASVPINEFIRESAFPYLYLGSFSQQVQGRYSGKRVFHQEFTLRSPNLGTVNLTDYDLIVGMTDGVWKHLPMRVAERGMVMDTNCEITGSEVIRSFRSRGPKEFVESLHNYVRANMIGDVRKSNEYSVIPNPGDVGIIATSI